MMHGYNNIWNYFIIGFVLLFLIALYVSSDATKRGYNGTLWALVVIFMPMMGIFFYLIFISISPYHVEKSGYYTRATVSPTSSSQHVSNHDFGSKASTESVYCTSCGFANDSISSYCKDCGVRLS